MGSIKKPKEFELVEVKIDGAQLKVTWNDGGELTTRDSNHPMHPDMQALFKTSKRYLVSYYDMDESKQEDIYIDRIKVHNYADNEGQSVQIFGTHTHVDSKQNTPLKTAKIQTHGDVYGYESELKALVSNLSKEACDYIFEGKSAQQEMEFDEEEKEAA